MRNTFITLFGKSASLGLKKMKLGDGSTLPGHLALKLNTHYIRDILQKSGIKVIIIAGTNGKTTSALMARAVLEAEGKKVIHNESGANLLNGIASSLVLQTTKAGTINAEYAIFEVDENALPAVLREVTPDYLILLNLFRDQLDRYGEVETIAAKWKASFAQLPKETTLIVNADDPKTAYLGMIRPNTVYFGMTGKSTLSLTDTTIMDSGYCPKCHTKLTYKTIYYSHLGDWSCPNCKLHRPDIKVSKDIKLSLNGTYNLYNAHGIIALSHEIGTPWDITAKALQDFIPAFGRQEKISFENKNMQLFLSKNPTGFNESIRTINELKGKHLMLVLNDGYADGTDVSWIWDTNLESYLKDFTQVTISGDRCYEMGLRVKYAESEGLRAKNIKIEPDLKIAITSALAGLSKDETLYILPTYTAMLAIRKIVTGKKIL